MLNISARSLVRYRRCHSPALSAAKVISFSKALMAILSLQTAMFSRFGQDFQHGRGMNISLCRLICLCIHGAGIYMIVNARRKLRKLGADTSHPRAEGAVSPAPASLLRLLEFGFKF